MEESEDEEEDKQGEEEESIGLPEEWSYQLQESEQARKRDNFEQEGNNTGQPEAETSKEELLMAKDSKQRKARTKDKWGPLKVDRKSRRNPEDTRTMMERAQDLKRKKAGVECNEQILEKPGNPFTQDSRDGTKLDNFVPPGQEERVDSCHLRFAEICKQTRVATMETSRFDQCLMGFLLKHGSNWELEDVTKDVLETMKTMTEAAGHLHDWMGTEMLWKGGQEEEGVQYAGSNNLGYCFKFH
ncbi:unnamed protein product [Urochloa humidicola]